MKITESAVAMSGQHDYALHTERHERLQVWADPVQASPAAQAPKEPQTTQIEPAKATGQNSIIPSQMDQLRLELIQALLEKLTGIKIQFQIPEELNAAIADGNADLEKVMQKVQEIKASAQGSSRTSGNDRKGWGLSYDLTERTVEQERMTFAAAGIVKTADGKEIDFSVALRMDRSFVEVHQEQIRMGDPKLTDPLVINFSGNAAELTETKFRFDLDANGEADQISFVGPGSGFLALDKNEDGAINDGKELFGPSSGQGFSELATYDEDKNGWIDENDSIYNKLRIWTKDAQGNDSLFALGQKDVGAIYLGNVEAPFSIKGQEQALLGQVHSTGVYLHENGLPGTVQQVDLAL